MSRSPLVVVFVVLGVSAGLVAVAWMLAGSPADDRLPPWVPLARSSAPAPPPPRDGERILHGNLFAWSERGPGPPSPPAGQPPPCADLRLAGTFVDHGTPAHSVALLGTGAGMAARREGARVSSWVVGHIDTLAVDLRDGELSCRLSLFAQPPPSEPRAAEGPPPTDRPPNGAGGLLPARQLGPHRWAVDRAALLALLTRPPPGLQVMPTGRGYRLVGRPPLLAPLGLRSSDVVRRVDGQPLTDTDAMLALLARRDTLERLELELLRDGELLRHEYLLE